MLKSAGNELFYYTFKEEVRNYGIDFLISGKDKDVICLYTWRICCSRRKSAIFAA